MRYNPDYIESLSTAETVGLLAHEVMHVALGHCWRRDEREKQRWNSAGDYAINENLIEAGFTLPEGALVEPNYRSLSTEEIYNKLPQQEKKKDDKNGQEGKNKEKGKSKQQSKDKDKTDRSDPGKCGIAMPTENEQEEKEMKAEWQAAISQALQVARGDVPADIKRQVQKIINPTIPWYILLRDFVERVARNDYDWTRPSRRYIGQNVVLPSLISEQLPEIAIAIDTSGSIDEEALSRFAIEASNVLGVYDTTIRIIYCDCKVLKEEVFTRADFPMKFNPIGGGGTNFQPVFNYIKEQHITPACLIYFTDLHGHFPKQEPEYPTMWLTTTKGKKAPFGVTVLFED